MGEQQLLPTSSARAQYRLNQYSLWFAVVIMPIMIMSQQSRSNNASGLVIQLHVWRDVLSVAIALMHRNLDDL